MKNNQNLESLLLAAKRGDKVAENEVFEILSVRFRQLIPLSLTKHPLIVKHANIEEKSREICDKAIQISREKCFLEWKLWTIDCPLKILESTIDVAIAEILLQLAYQNVENAENRLFSFIRQKLINKSDGIS